MSLDEPTSIRRGEWPKRLSIAFVVAALFAVFIGGSFFAAVCFLICAVMGMTNAIEKRRATGARTVSDPQRIVIGSVFAVLGLFLIWPKFDGASDNNLAEVGLAAPQKVASEPKLTRDADRESKPDKLKRFLEGEKTLERDDIFNRLSFWKDIAAIDPTNAVYAKTRDDLQSQVDEVNLRMSLPSKGADVIKVRPRKEGFGNVMVVDVTIQNRGLSNLKDFVVECSNKGPSGTVINTNTRTVFEIVPSRATRTFKSVNMGFINQQTKSTNCQVVSAEIS
jgi:hypothetical protein